MVLGKRKGAGVQSRRSAFVLVPAFLSHVQYPPISYGEDGAETKFLPVLLRDGTLEARGGAGGEHGLLPCITPTQSMNFTQCQGWPSFRRAGCSSFTNQGPLSFLTHKMNRPDSGLSGALKHHPSGYLRHGDGPVGLVLVKTAVSSGVIKILPHTSFLPPTLLPQFAFRSIPSISSTVWSSHGKSPSIQMPLRKALQSRKAGSRLLFLSQQSWQGVHYLQLVIPLKRTLRELMGNPTIPTHASSETLSGDQSP